MDYSHNPTSKTLPVVYRRFAMSILGLGVMAFSHPVIKAVITATNDMLRDLTIFKM